MNIFTKPVKPTLNQEQLRHVIDSALAEDLGLPLAEISKSKPGELLKYDVTSASTLLENQSTSATLIFKQKGIIAGLDAALTVFHTVDPQISCIIDYPEGTKIASAPVVVARINGNARAIMLAERTALNIIQRLSGIATITNSLVEKASKFGIEILDTRKTTPGLRALEKYAVSVGGGKNHRFGLFDAILIKDNHINLAGGIEPAVAQARRHFPNKPVEVEVATQQELNEALALKVEHIMLDNMTPVQITAAIEQINGASFIEVSGGINAQNIDRYLIKGINAISLGSLTHSVSSLDISLEIGG